MKLNIASCLALASGSYFAQVVSAHPVEDIVLPDGFEPISGAEIRQRLSRPVEASVEKRTAGGIYICTGENWTGTCGYKVQPVCYSGQCGTRDSIAAHCVTLTSPWVNNIGSLGPDSGTRVAVSVNGNCNEASGVISYPGNAALKHWSSGGVNNFGSHISTFLALA